MITVSIIIPYYNRPSTIKRCVDSIDVSRFCGVEVIIVDDCSTMPMVAFDSPAISIIRLDSNMGPVAARSHGAIKANNDYLLFLDSDDELLPQWFDLLCQQVSTCPGYDVYGFPDEKYKDGINYDIRDADSYWQWVPLESRASDYLLVIRTSSYCKMPMPTFRISEIWYIVQLFESNLQARYSKKPLFKYNQDAGNQLSKSTGWKFDPSAYSRHSVYYAIVIFKRNRARIKRSSLTFYNAWYKRFLKECFLSVNVPGLFYLVLGDESGKKISFDNMS